LSLVLADVVPVDDADLIAAGARLRQRLLSVSAVAAVDHAGRGTSCTARWWPRSAR
jgi:hypothetical protein